MGKPRAENISARTGGRGVSSTTASSSISRSTHLGLLIILLIFVTLTTLYSFVAPITQGEDELAHYRYLSFIAQTGRLPVSYAEREQAWYRADWPPLYHLLVGWSVSWLDTSQPHLKDVGESPRRRLVGEIFYPRLIIYTEDANWPWQDGILAWHIGRFISIAFAAGALVFTYLTVLEMGREAESHPNTGGFPPLLPRSSVPLLALTTTAFLAFIPRYMFTSAMLGDDSLFILLSASFIWLLLRALRGDDHWWVYAILGLLLGLSIATKYSTGLLPLILIPVVWWRARQVGWGWTKALGRILLAWVFTFLGASWWFGWIGYHFNTIKEDGLLFGLLQPILASGPDVSMRRIFAFFSPAQFTGQERPDAVEVGNFLDWLVYLFQTFWGVPVLEADPFFPWVYLILLVFCGLALAGLWRLWRGSDNMIRLTLSVLVLIVALLLPFPVLRFFLTHNVLETGQGRHILYPAAQAIPILLMFGWAAFWSRRRPDTGHGQTVTRQHIRFTFYVALWPLLLLIWSIGLLIYMVPAYPDPLPVQTTTFDPTSIPQPLARTMGDDIQLLGYDFEPDPDLAIIDLTLYWRSLKPVDQNYRVRVQLVDADGQTRFAWLSHPLNGRYPTRAWDQGDIIRDKVSLPLAAVPPDVYDIQIDLLPEVEDAPLTPEPLSIIQFTLPTRQPIVGASTMAGIEYRLWVGDGPARHRQTLPLSWLNRANDVENSLQWSLVGPDDIARPPRSVSVATAMFMVGADWPSGDYRLQLDRAGSDSQQTEPLVTIANDARLFDLPALPEGYTPTKATFVNTEGRPQLKLLGYTLPVRRIQPGGALPLTLYWQSLTPVLEDTVTFAVLLDANQQPHGSVDRYPSGFYSPLLWAEDEVVVDEFSLPIHPDAPPGVYFLHIGQYRLVNGQPQSLPLLYQDQVTDQTAVVIGPVKVGGSPPEVVTIDPKSQFALDQNFGDQITLLGYDLTDEAGQPIRNSMLDTQNLKFTFYWRADTDLQTDYTTFLHLRDSNNENAAQKDGPPAAGRYPTSLWSMGDIVVDQILLPLDDLSPGEYTPVVGLYEYQTGTRLTVPGVPSNEIPLEPIRLEP